MHKKKEKNGMDKVLQCVSKINTKTSTTRILAREGTSQLYIYLSK